MPRTPEQEAADKALEEAIELVTKAYDYIDPGEIITTWIVVGSALGFEHGDPVDSFFILTPDQHQSPFQSIGLLRYGQVKIEKNTVDVMTLLEYDDDDLDDEDEDEDYDE